MEELWSQSLTLWRDGLTPIQEAYSSRIYCPSPWQLLWHPNPHMNHTIIFYDSRPLLRGHSVLKLLISISIKKSCKPEPVFLLPTWASFALTTPPGSFGRLRHLLKWCLSNLTFILLVLGGKTNQGLAWARQVLFQWSTSLAPKLLKWGLCGLPLKLLIEETPKTLCEGEFHASINICPQREANDP